MALNTILQINSKLNAVTGHTISPISSNGIILGSPNINIRPAIYYPTPKQIAGLVKMGPCTPIDCRYSNQLKCYMNRVFGLMGLASYQNDVNSFLMSVPTGGSYVYQFVINKNTLHYLNPSNWNQWAWQQKQVITNNNYGYYYKLGSLAASPNYMGFSVNWGSVLNSFGPGIYQIAIQACLVQTTPATLFVPIPLAKPALYSNAVFNTFVSSNLGTGNLTATFSTGQKYTVAFNAANGLVANLNILIAAIKAGATYTASYTAGAGLKISSLTAGASANGVTVNITSSNPSGIDIQNGAGGHNITLSGGANGATYGIKIGTTIYSGIISGTQLQNSTYMAGLINAGGIYTATATVKGGIQGLVISSTNGATANGTHVYTSLSGAVYAVVGSLSGGGTTQGQCTNLLCSEPFDLAAWDCNKAAGTVKFEFTNSGTIGDDVNDGILFNLTGMNWYDSIRVPGFFGEQGWKFNETLMEYGLDANHDIGQLESVQNKKIPGYTFYSKLLPYWLHNHLSTWLMGDNILVSDYGTNQPDYEGMQQKSVRMANNADYMPKWLSKNRFEADMRYKQKSGYVKVEFQAGIQSIIKDIC